MTTVNTIADLIGEIDGDNRMTATELGLKVAAAITHDPASTHHLDDLRLRDGIQMFVERTNPDKRMSAGQLAELIVAEFDLTKHA